MERLQKTAWDARVLVGRSVKLGQVGFTAVGLWLAGLLGQVFYFILFLLPAMPARRDKRKGKRKR